MVLHTHIYRTNLINDVEQYVKLLRLRENERGGEGCYCKSESYQSGSMHVNESIDRRADRCCIYNTGEG